MNANKWPLERVRRIEFETPLPLNDCMQRVEQLNEPQRSRGELPLKDINHQWRIAVNRDVQFSGQVLYNIGVVYVTEPYTARLVNEEARLKLLPLEYNTRVTIQYAQTQQKPNQMTGLVLKILTVISVVSLMLEILAGEVEFSFFCFVSLIVALLIGLNNLNHHQTRQQKILLTRIYKAFDLTYRAKAANGYQKDG